MENRYKIINSIAVNFLILVLLTLFALWMRTLDINSSWQKAGLVNMSLGFVILIAYVISKEGTRIYLPLISGYIFAGIIAGPYVSGFLTIDMVERLRLIDDLALSFIALTAGGALRLQSLKRRRTSILSNITLQVVIVFFAVFLFVRMSGKYFSITENLPAAKIVVFAILLGTIAIARSPSSAIAIISECRAAGVFVETVLGVTITIDVLIIILFTVALTVSKIFLSSSGILDASVFIILLGEMGFSILIGAILGKGISLYISRIRHDLPLFLLFIAFGVAKTSFWLTGFMEAHFNIFLHLEPLLICMSAGFFVQNFSREGPFFMESLERMALPIFVLFFSLAGASLNMTSLIACWPFALCFASVRMAGIFCSTWLAGTLSRDKAIHRKTAWMAYMTQAGVAIGLAQLAERQFPEIGVYLTTVVLAVITINQIVGPIMFKAALNIVGETGKQ